MQSYGWKAVFYSTAGLGFIWCAAWKYLMYDKPDYHPRLSIEEKRDIKNETQGTDLSSKVFIFHNIRLSTYSRLSREETTLLLVSILKKLSVAPKVCQSLYQFMIGFWCTLPML